MDKDLKILIARMHLRYDDVLDTEAKMDYKSFTPDNLEFNRLWISTDAKAAAAFTEMLSKARAEEEKE